MDNQIINGVYRFLTDQLISFTGVHTNYSLRRTIQFKTYESQEQFSEIIFDWNSSGKFTMLYDSTIAFEDEAFTVDPDYTEIDFGLNYQVVDMETEWADILFNSLELISPTVTRYFRYLDGTLITRWNLIVGQHSSATPDNVVVPPYKEIRGWSLYNDGYSPYNFSQDVYQDQTLYVYFKQGVQSVVTINVDGVETTQIVTTGTKATRPTSPTKEGYTFLGWSYSPDNFVYFDFDDVIIRENITVYAYFNIDSFSINIYQNLSDTEVVNKNLQSLGVITGYLRDSSSITNITFRVEQAQPPQFNYIYVEIFNRYYYVTNIYSIVTGVWGIETSIDVLMTYKDLIKRQTAYVTRQEFLTNPDVIDDITSYEQEPIILTQKVDTTPFETDTDANSTHCYVINVVRRNV